MVTKILSLSTIQILLEILSIQSYFLFLLQYQIHNDWSMCINLVILGHIVNITKGDLYMSLKDH